MVQKERVGSQEFIGVQKRHCTAKRRGRRDRQREDGYQIEEGENTGINIKVKNNKKDERVEKVVCRGKSFQLATSILGQNKTERVS